MPLAIRARELILQWIYYAFSIRLHTEFAVAATRFAVLRIV